MNENFITSAVYDMVVKKVNAPWLLIPFGDVHYGNPSHASARFQEFLDECEADIKAYQDRVRFIGMGDYFEVYSGSERAIVETHKLHDSTILRRDEVLQREADAFFELIKFMKGRTLGLLEGNHFANFSNLVTTTPYLCEKLECPYLAKETFIKLKWDYSNKKKSLVIHATHGAGGASTPGGSINRVDRMAKVAQADISLMGHDHQRGAWPGVQIYMDTDDQIKEKLIYIGRTGSFLKTRQVGKPSYADPAWPATALGSLKFMMIPRTTAVGKAGRKKLYKFRVELKAVS